MPRFNVNDKVCYVGTYETAIIREIKESDLSTFYRIDEGMAWIPERKLWDGNPAEKIAFCSQLNCQRKITLTLEVEGTHYVKDDFLNPMCIEHQEDVKEHGWNGFSDHDE